MIEDKCRRPEPRAPWPSRGVGAGEFEPARGIRPRVLAPRAAAIANPATECQDHGRLPGGRAITKLLTKHARRG